MSIKKLANNSRCGGKMGDNIFRSSSSNGEDCNEIVMKDILTFTDKSYSKSSDNIDNKNESVLVKSSVTEESMDCNKYKKSFLRGYGLNINENIIVENLCKKKNHECEICLRNFSQKDNLKLNQAIHSGGEPHEYEISKEKFYNKTNLKVHQTIHPGDKPHECEICNKNSLVRAI